MSLIFRKTLRGPAGTRVNVSKRGVSLSRTFGPVTVSSRGRVTIRLPFGLSVRL